MLTKSDNWVISELLNLAIWLIVFGLVNWLASDNLWLCFFITTSLMIAFSNNAIKDVLKFLQPVHSSIDSCINELKAKNDELENDVEELRESLRKLKIKFDEFDHQLNPFQHREPL